MINKTKFYKFLIKAKKATYAAGDKADKILEDNKSTTLVFKDGDCKYEDNYFGGEPFGGREVVYFKNKPIYIMVYYGNVDKSVSDFKIIYEFLQKALSQMPINYPYRGPKKFIENNKIYKNNYNGEIDNFSGEEEIFIDKKKLYLAKYMGGFANLR